MLRGPRGRVASTVCCFGGERDVSGVEDADVGSVIGQHFTNWAGRFHGKKKAKFNLAAGREPGWRGRSTVLRCGRGTGHRTGI